MSPPVKSRHDDVGGNAKDVQCTGFKVARTLPPVRRYLAILLLALLPAQFSWAMVGQYCAHETGAQSQHLGHHSHQHVQSDTASAQADASDADDASQAPPGGIHPDCHSCHLSCGVVVPTPLAHTALPGSSVLPGAPVLAVGTQLSDQPERPQWPHSRTPV